MLVVLLTNGGGFTYILTNGGDFNYILTNGGGFTYILTNGGGFTYILTNVGGFTYYWWWFYLYTYLWWWFYLQVVVILTGGAGFAAAAAKTCSTASFFTPSRCGLCPLTPDTWTLADIRNQNNNGSNYTSASFLWLQFSLSHTVYLDFIIF